MRLLELWQQSLAGKIPASALPMTFPSTLNRLLGIELVSIDAGRCVMTMATDIAKHANPKGTIHGGVMCDLGDAAIGCAHATGLEEGESFTSVDLKINFFRPVWNDVLTATAYAVRQGRTLSYYECDLTNTEGKLVAKLTSTVMTLRDDAARGR